MWRRSHARSAIERGDQSAEPGRKEKERRTDAAPATPAKGHTKQHGRRPRAGRGPIAAFVCKSKVLRLAVFAGSRWTLARHFKMSKLRPAAVWAISIPEVNVHGMFTVISMVPGARAGHNYRKLDWGEAEAALGNEPRPTRGLGRRITFAQTPNSTSSRFAVSVCRSRTPLMIVRSVIATVSQST